MIIPLGLGAVSYGTLARLCGSTVPTTLKDCVPDRLVTDSREIQKGDLFCALKGRADGHSYANEAAERGAVAILAEKKTDAPIPHILVSSVRGALGKWASGVAASPSLLRIGITGSVGKTTTKDALFSMLSPHYAVHATHGNYNNDLGLPFTLLSAPKETKIVICELGTGGVGEMEALSNILRPHISLITCIGHAHIGAFGTREAIAKEKLRILSHAQDGGLLFVCAKESLLSLIPPKGIRRIPVLPFEMEDYKAAGLFPDTTDVSRNFALAYAQAVAKELALPSGAIREGLGRVFALKTHRTEEEYRGILFLDDGYNASPESMLGALSYLSSKAKGRRIAVLGDMLELGAESGKYHRAVGRFAMEHADLLFFYGAYAKEYALGAASAVPKNKRFASSKPEYTVLGGERSEIAQAVAERLQVGDTVLFKASRALKTELLISEIKKQI